MSYKGSALKAHLVKQGAKKETVGEIGRYDKQKTISSLKKTLEEAKKKLEKMEAEKYPDEMKIQRAKAVVSQLQQTLSKEGVIDR